MHERLRIDENARCRNLVWQVALVDDDQGVVFRTMTVGQRRPEPGKVGYWNLRTGRLEPDPRAFPKTHACRCFSANGRCQVVATRKNVHYVWDRVAEKTVARLDVPPEYRSLHVSDDGRTVALAGTEVALWHASTGAARPLPALKQGVNLLSPSGRRLVAPPAATVYNAETGARLFTFPADGSFGTFSPDGRSFLYTYNHRAKLFDLETGEKRESLVAPFEIIGGAVSPDHTRIAVGGIFEGVRVWEVPSEDVLATWMVRDRYIRRLCFSADGSRLVAASNGGVFRLCDVAGGGERAALVLLENDAWATLTPDGYFLGSDNLADVAQWQIDGRAVPFDRYAKRYHRPKRVAEVLRPRLERRAAVTIEAHVEAFGGLRVRDFVPAKGLRAPETTAYRVGLDHDDIEIGKIRFADLFDALLADANVGRLTKLAVGLWGGEWGTSSAVVVEMLVAARRKLSGLTGLFLGDIIRPEQEISWIVQSDVSALWAAFPKLEQLHVRGGNGFGFGAIRHNALRSLVVETGGLSRDVVAEVARARLPTLEHLELWLGSEWYGGNATVDDLRPFLTGKRFPKLRSLALRNFRWTDALAEAVAASPVLRQLDALDLSLGALGDEGARALLAAPPIRKLKKLDLHRHYLSAEMMTALQQLPLAVDVSGKTEPRPGDGDDDGRYVAVSE